MDKSANIRYLFSRYCNHLSTRQEYDDFMQLLEKSAHDTALRTLLAELYHELTLQQNVAQNLEQMPEIDLGSKENLPTTAENPEQTLATEPAVKRRTLWPRIAVAVAAIVTIVFGLWFFSASRHLDDGRDLLKYAKNDLAPGKNTATLTLANGRQIKLNAAASGKLAEEAGIIIRKSADGQVVYEISGRQADAKHIKYNTLQTAKGEQYQVILPDGSKVWLNAASSLKYPSSFAGLTQREVELSGEAYFEIFRNKKQPFVVNSKKMELTVLGTHFNVNAYNDESSTKATLLEGSVRVTSRTAINGRLNTKYALLNTTLKPGQQAAVTANNLTVKQVDVSEVTAWKNGKFSFNNASLQEVMKQLSRWYDVEVIYPQGIPDRTFTGDINRNVNASEALSLLAFTKVKFKIEGKTIIVTK